MAANIYKILHLLTDPILKNAFKAYEVSEKVSLLCLFFIFLRDLDCTLFAVYGYVLLAWLD